MTSDEKVPYIGFQGFTHLPNVPAVDTDTRVPEALSSNPIHRNSF